MVAFSAQRVSTTPPGSSGVPRTPTNGCPGSGVVRTASGAPTSIGAAWTSTVKLPEVVGPARQSLGPPDPGPSDTATV
jgi:hypothetical protein